MTARSLTTDIAASFPAVETAKAEILILGSMPGRASLLAQQYYAHPRNAFWPVMGALLGFDPAAPYDVRIRTLQAAHVALWDVLRTCKRPGSLDAAIDHEHASLQANDFRLFFQAHPAIRRIYFNGATAETCFRRYVANTPGIPALPAWRLPSTSPAHAALRLEQKLEAWRVILETSAG